MFSLPLFKQTVKANWVMFAVMGALMAIFLAQFAGMEMTQSLLLLIYYGMIGLILPTIYILISSNKLLAGQVDKGSMAYVLSTPKRRITVCLTQIIYQVGTVVIMFAVTTVAHLIVNAAMPLDLASAAAVLKINVIGTLSAKQIVLMNLTSCASCLALSGLCYMFSGIFNLSKFSSGCSGIVCGVSILGSLFGMFGSMLNVDALALFKYVSVYSFFDVEGILTGTSTWIVLFIVALCISVIAYVVGTLRFCKKDLPL
ncbi:MAG: hypothetical protein K2M95_03945 [Clostridiales bacterium]|nr:hypothetical protein [Clostridiales bacterium]